MLMALDVVTTATATQNFFNKTIVLAVNAFGTLTKITDYTQTINSGLIETLASGYNNKFDDRTYY